MSLEITEHLPTIVFDAAEDCGKVTLESDGVDAYGARIVKLTFDGIEPHLDRSALTDLRDACNAMLTAMGDSE